MAIETSVGRRAPVVARRMEEAAKRFLASLDSDLRSQAEFEFSGEERYFWHYTPVERSGLMLRYMTAEQRQAAFALMATGLSEWGDREARDIIDLEPILKLHERIDQRPEEWERDEERYWFSVFGEPGGSSPWGWRVGGHHIGLHYTLVDRDLISPLPLFFGANPAQVRYGPHAGRRTLAAEEDLARDLLKSLDPDRKAVAVVDPVAPADILTRNYRVADPTAPLAGGLTLSAMTDPQRDRLVALVRHYVERTSPELAQQEWDRIERAGLDLVTFAWAGPEDRARGNGHYYAVKGAVFLIEYDNTQNEANHIHSVWRDYGNDWGEDLLADHYREDHEG